MNLEIVKKSEAWKFSPVNKIQTLELKTKSDLTVSGLKKIRLAMGPTEQQIHTVLIKDLIEAGTAEISTKKASSYFFEDSNTSRAKLDRSLEDFGRSENTILLKILKSPQSTIWIDPKSLGTNLEIELESGAEASIVFFETDSNSITAVDSSFFRTSFNLGDESVLELGLSQSSAHNSLSQINVSLGEKAHFNSYSLMTGTAEYKRLEINVFQKGANSSATLNGLNATKSNGTFDYHSNVFHLNKDQETFQNFKAVCKDQSKSIFTGRVHLTENSSGAAVKQLNNNLLLGDKSSVDTQPELNIYHDNVKAAHGATTSSLNEDHIFYFSSRGFKPEHTKKILLDAFCKSTCDSLKNKGIKDFFTSAVSKELYSDRV
jgi:hypothetical protein